MPRCKPAEDNVRAADSLHEGWTQEVTPMLDVHLVYQIAFSQDFEVLTNKPGRTIMDECYAACSRWHQILGHSLRMRMCCAMQDALHLLDMMLQAKGFTCSSPCGRGHNIS